MKQLMGSTPHAHMPNPNCKVQDDTDYRGGNRNFNSWVQDLAGIYVSNGNQIPFFTYFVIFTY